MERVTTDIMGPLDKTTSGNKYILVVTDMSSPSGLRPMP